MALRRAGDGDWEAVTGMPAPGYWFGLVEETGPLVEGLGAIYRDDEGRWWITFKRLPFVAKVKTAHKAARRLIDEARSLELEIRALADLSIDGAELWLERLGFHRTDETIEGHAVWLIQ